MPEILSLSHYHSIMQDSRRYPSRLYTHPSLLTATNPPWHQLPIRAELSQSPLELASHYSALFGSFAPQGPDWSLNSAIPLTCAAALPDNFTYSTTQSPYPESSQRPNVSSPIDPASDYQFHAEVPRSPSRSSNDSHQSHHLYTMDEIVEAPISCRSSAMSSPSVKVEQPDADGCFVMELSAAQANTISLSQSMAPPTENPVRATHASEEMKKMMGRFRIDPFAIHNGEQRGVVASWCGEACPLEEEPLIFEFQLDIGGQEDASRETPDSASASQASREASSEHDGDWEKYSRDETVFASNPPSEWNISDSGDQPPSSSEPTAALYHQQLQGLRESYLPTCDAESYLHSATPTHDLRAHRAEPHAQFWHRRGAYSTAPRTTPYYTADSPECDNAVLPSISATVNRRWSLTDPNLANAVQFLMQ